MATEAYEIVKQFVFDVPDLGPVKGLICKQLHPSLPNPFMWRTNYSCNAFEPRTGVDISTTERDLFEYIESFHAPSAVIDENF